MLGIAAASSAKANSVQIGPPKCVAKIRPTKAATESVVAGIEHAALAEPIHQAGNLRRDERVGEREGGGDRARQPVLAVRLGQHGDDADRRHGNRQAGDEAGRREALGSRRLEDLAIGIGHEALLDSERSATYIRGVCNEIITYAAYVK